MALETRLMKPPPPVEIVEAGILSARQKEHIERLCAAEKAEECRTFNAAKLDAEATRLYLSFAALISSSGATFDSTSCVVVVRAKSSINHFAQYKDEIETRLKRHFATERITLQSLDVDVDDGCGSLYRTVVRDGECQRVCCLTSWLCCGVPFLTYWLPMFVYHRCCKTASTYRYTATLSPSSSR